MLLAERLERVPLRVCPASTVKATREARLAQVEPARNVRFEEGEEEGGRDGRRHGQREVADRGRGEPPEAGPRGLRGDSSGDPCDGHSLEGRDGGRVGEASWAMRRRQADEVVRRDDEVLPPTEACSRQHSLGSGPRFPSKLRFEANDDGIDEGQAADVRDDRLAFEACAFWIPLVVAHSEGLLPWGQMAGPKDRDEEDSESPYDRRHVGMEEAG